MTGTLAATGHLRQEVGLDIEGHDPLMKERGVGWVFDEYEILCAATSVQGENMYHSGCPAYIAEYLTNPTVILIGANIGYDVGCIIWKLGLKVTDVKAKLIDVLHAEAHINEYADISLESLAKKYLGIGKKKSSLEEWAESEGLKGDVRRHLKKAPEELLKEYVLSDAELPVLIWQKQKEILLKENIMTGLEVDNNLILPILDMKKTGLKVDMDLKKKYEALVEEELSKRERAFFETYGEVNVKSSKQLAELFDREGIPYNYKITIKMWNDVVVTPNNCRDVLAQLRGRIHGISVFKKTLCIFCPKPHVKAYEEDAIREGCKITSNPTLDKYALEEIGVKYPEVVGTILDMKKAKDILSKVLCEKYNRFIASDSRIHPSFRIAKSEEGGTISNRFSSNMPNGQQLPSKGTLFKGSEFEINIPQITRGMFVADKGNLIYKIDYSQVEYRLLAHYAVGLGSDEVRRMFNENPYTDYHQLVMDMSGLARKDAKNLNFGVMYGMKVPSMSKLFGWDIKKATELYETYQEAMPFVEYTMDYIQKVTLKRLKTEGVGYVRTLAGRKARLDYESRCYTMLNRLNQGSAADVMKKAILDAWDSGVYNTLKHGMSVHDEDVGEMPYTEEGFNALMKLQECMEGAYKDVLKVPLIAEPELGPSWYNASPIVYPKGTIVTVNEEEAEILTGKPFWDKGIMLETSKGAFEYNQLKGA